MPDKPQNGEPNPLIDRANVYQSNIKRTTNISDASKQEVIEAVTNSTTNSSIETYFEDDEFDEIIRKTL